MEYSSELSLLSESIHAHLRENTNTPHSHIFMIL